MPAAISRLQRIRVFEESTFATDMSASIASFQDVRAIGPIDAALPPGFLKDDSLRQRPYEDRKDIQGPRGRAKFALKCYLMPSGVALTNASTAPAAPRTATGRILKAALAGGWFSDKGDLAVAASTTILVKATVGTRFSAGRAICVPTGAGGAYEMRVASGISVNDISLKMATTNAQTNGAAILNTETFCPGDPTILGGLQFVVESPARKAIVWLRGAQLVGGFSLDIPLKGLPILTLNIEAADWYRDHEAAVSTPLNGSSIAAATYTDGDPQPFIKSTLLWGSAGVTTLGTLDIYEAKFTPSWSCLEVTAPDGPNGIRGWYPDKPEPLGTFMFKCRVDDASPYNTGFFDDMVARTDKQALIQIGNTAGNIYGIDLSRLQIIDVQDIGVQGNVRQWQVTCKVLEDTNATDMTTRLRTALWRLHQG